MGFLKGLRCFDCGKDYPADASMTTCPDCEPKGLFFGLLDPVNDYKRIGQVVNKESLEQRRPGLWKYLEFMPISDESKIVSMGEGGTPLVRSQNLAMHLGLKNLYLKNESVTSTYSFKDRAMSLAVSRAMEEGVKAAALVSDGNCGASAAAYCARAGIECYVFMPKDSVQAKLTRVLIYGAHVIIVDGFVFDAGMLCLQACQRYGWANISQVKALNPYPTEGHKTISCEICEQLGWQSPDWLLTPTTGESFTCQWKGYQEFYQLGFVESLPRMVAVQGKGADPLVRAFDRNLQWYEVEPFEPETICDAIPVGNILGPGALAAIRESGGRAIAVSDDEVLEAQKLLAAKEGIFAEPSSSIPIAALKMLLDQDLIDQSETVVCVITGAGPSVPDVAERQVEKPNVIKPTLEALEEFLE